MNKNEMRTLLKDLTEQKAPAAQIDLWPAIQAQLPMSQPEPSRGTIMKTQSQSQFRRWKPAYLLLAVLLIGAIFFALPQGRALGQAVLHFFQRGTSNLMPGVTVTPMKWVEQTPGVAAATLTPLPRPGLAYEAECGAYSSPRCSIEEIRVKVSFPVFGLSPIPDGLYFTGATGSPDRVHIIYQTKDQHGTLTIDEEPWTGSPGQKAWEVGSNADIQTVMVGSVTAEYVKGSYDGSRNPPEWNPNLGVQSLRWVEHGILFTMMLTSGTEPPLDNDSLSALIGALTDGSLAAVPPITAEKPTADPIAEIQKSVDYIKERFSLSIEQAEQQSGIKIHLPTRLPDVLTLQGARYEPEQKWVIVFYLFDQSQWGPNTDGLSLTEQAAPNTGDCPLCGFVTGDASKLDTTAPGKLVGKDAVIEPVQIGSVTGHYVEGVWQAKGDIHGMNWESDPYMKRLRWQANGIAYELAYMGMGITKEDMIVIAENMK